MAILALLNLSVLIGWVYVKKTTYTTFQTLELVENVNRKALLEGVDQFFYRKCGFKPDGDVLAEKVRKNLLTIVGYIESQDSASHWFNSGDSNRLDTVFLAHRISSDFHRHRDAIWSRLELLRANNDPSDRLVGLALLQRALENNMKQVAASALRIVDLELVVSGLQEVYLVGDSLNLDFYLTEPGLHCSWHRVDEIRVQDSIYTWDKWVGPVLVAHSVYGNGKSQSVPVRAVFNLLADKQLTIEREVPVMLPSSIQTTIE